MDCSELSILSLVLAGFSLLVAYLSYRKANKALNIEKERERRYLEEINCELVKGIHIATGKESIIYIFILLINNSSSSKRSIVEANLNINYTDREDYNRTVILKHDPNLAKKYNIKDYEFAPINPYLDEFESSTLGFVFESNKKLIKDNYIDSFHIVLKDSLGKQMNVESILTTSYQKESDNEDSKK